MDFVVFSGIHSNLLHIADCFSLSSDHSALLLNFDTLFDTIAAKYRPISRKTDLKSFQYHLDAKLNFDISITNNCELENAVENFTNAIHEAACMATDSSTPTAIVKNSNNVYIPDDIKELIKEKRKLRRLWQNTRYPSDKTKLNRATKILKKRLFEEKNQRMADFLGSLGVSSDNEYSLWKATKYLKRPCSKNIMFKDKNGTWCKTPETQANAFASNLEEIFQPLNLSHQSHINAIEKYIDSACQLELPLKDLSTDEVIQEISKLKTTKSPGYDRIDGQTAKLLTLNAVKYLAFLFNSSMRLYHFPLQWKIAEIIMIVKPGKPDSCITSYRPISLLPIFSKIFEKILLSRILPVLEAKEIIPEHQFGFRRHHGTPEQCHRVIETITNALENKLYCSAVFLDVKQAFDRVWHLGLIYKLKKIFCPQMYLLIKSYLSDRCFYVRVKDETSMIYKIKSGVPQGSVLGPVLYTLFTADIPTNSNTVLATYADDTALLSSHVLSLEAATNLQEHLNQLDEWFRKWNIQVNCDKSVNVTYTLRKGDCPSVKINDEIIPKKESAKYLGLHIDKRLTWKTHVLAKRQQLEFKKRKMNWLLGRNSELSIENKIRIYKTILKPIWTYGIQLWGTTSNSNIEILQRFQSKILRSIVNAPWFITNRDIHKDLHMPYIKNEVNRLSERYLNRLSYHENLLAIGLLDISCETTRLKRYHIHDLPFRK